MSHPLVSIVMPIYNGEKYLSEAIDCILKQSFENFELIILNDGSKDNSQDIIESYTDPRMIKISHTNMGLARTLNAGIEKSRGKYIARQDQDDISKPQRLAKQVEFMESYPQIGFVGTIADIWIETNPTERKHSHPTDNAILQFELLFNNPFVHSSMMIRKEALDQVGVYTTDPDKQPPEDYDLWSRIARQYQIANLPESLVIYREASQSMSRAGSESTVLDPKTGLPKGWVNPFLNRVVNICASNLHNHSGEKVPLEICLILSRKMHVPGYPPILEPERSSVICLMDILLQKFSESYPPMQEYYQQRIHGLKYSISYIPPTRTDRFLQKLKSLFS